jgi:predicted nucleic acid-binding protein
MTGRDFLDTNVLVYAVDLEDTRKHEIARPMLTKALQGEFSVSVQVLAEFTSNLLHKHAGNFKTEEVTAFLGLLRRIPLIKPDVEIVRRAVEAHAAYGVHFYDGMIIAAAERAGAKRILSEDLNAGQKYFGVEVVNPFA